MKLKVILSTLIFVFVGGISLSQISSPVLAHKSPISSPITIPITSAMATVKLSGWVKYLKHFHFVPAGGANVMAKDKKTNDIFSVTADADGKYVLMVPKGKYSVWVDGVGDFANFKFLPNLSSLKLLFDLHLDFFGLPKH